MTISILKAERFYPLGKPIQRPAKDDSKKDGEQVRPGIWRKPDGTMETRGYETPKPATKPADPEPAKAEAAALGDGWIACGPDMPDIPEGRYQLKRLDTRGAVHIPGDGSGHWSLRNNLTSEAQYKAHAYRLIPTEAA